MITAPVDVELLSKQPGDRRTLVTPAAPHKCDDYRGWEQESSEQRRLLRLLRELAPRNRCHNLHRPEI